jgi:hypothetical protein
MGPDPVRPTHLLLKRYVHWAGMTRVRQPRWLPGKYRSRIHLLAAREAATLAILQRKRSKLFHVIVVDTGTLRITVGSWFRGKLYPLRCDVSFDGGFIWRWAPAGKAGTASVAFHG